ncbi:MAG: IS630 family transposase, partial [Pyrinomonadaceae bacterium]
MADGLTDEQIGAALNTGIATVERTRQRFVKEGLGCLNERTRPGQRRKLSNSRRLYAGARWAGSLDVAIARRQGGGVGFRPLDSARDGAPSVKKNELKPWLKEQWCLPEVRAEFVACMEDVLD